MPPQAWMLPLIAAFISLALAVLVAVRAQRGELRAVFVFLATILVFWNLNFFVLSGVSNPELAFALSRTARSMVMFLPPAILHLSLAVREGGSGRWRGFLGLDYGMSALLVIANALDLVVVRIQPHAWGYLSVAGPAANLFTALLVLNFITAMVVYVKEFRTCANPRTRVQLQFWLLGALIGVPLGFTNLLNNYGIPVYRLGDLGSAAWAAIVAYAIVRHRLLDIDVVVTKGVAYGSVALVLIAPAFGLSLWFQKISFGQIHADFSFAILLMLVTVGVLFPALRMRAESRLEQSLFRTKYEDRSVLLAFSGSLVRILDRDRLVRDLASTLLETLRLDRVAVALSNPTGRVFTVSHALGVPPADDHFADSDSFLSALHRRRQAALREEIEATATRDERPRVQELCTRNGWQAFIPLEGGGDLIGFVALGAKRTRDAFFSGELQILDGLGAQASIALENARLYEELKRSQEIIRRSDRLSALGTLAAGIAHEIRNPLVSIQTFFQLAPERLHDEEFLTTFLSLTSGEVKRITTLISELLTFARSPMPAVGPVDLNEVADRVVALLAPEARKHKVALECVPEPTMRPVLADTDQIKQVLINLVLNAIQATPPDGNVKVLCRSTEHHGEPCGQVEVHDTGVGIPADLVDNVFNPFFTTKDKGTGLGLTIANQIVTEHGGFISVESTEGAGTRFLVSLPTSDHAATEPAAAAEG